MVGATLHYSYRACGFSNEFESWFYQPPPPSPPPSPPPPSPPLDCPCLTAYPAGVSLVSGEVQVVAADGVSLAYPGTYGLHGCDSHDSGLEPSCNSTGYPGWCEHEWCYVDPTACNTEYSTTAYVVGATLHYSYRACGFSNEFESWFYQPPPPSPPYLPGMAPASPPPSPPLLPPSPPLSPLLPRYVECGRAGYCSEPARWATPSERHEVRCCSDALPQATRVLRTTESNPTRRKCTARVRIGFVGP